MAKESINLQVNVIDLEKCRPALISIGLKMHDVGECLTPFSEDINSSFLQREKLKNSLEVAHEAIKDFLREFSLPVIIKMKIIHGLETLLLVAEFLHSNSFGGGYNVMYDIYHTIRTYSS